MKQYLKGLIDDMPELCATLECGAYLAGGLLRDVFNGENAFKDIDIFFKDIEARDKALSILPLENIKRSEYVTTGELRGDVYQLVHKDYYDSMESLIECFDFTNIMCAYDGRDVKCSDDFIIHNSLGIVGINIITKPLSSLNRLVPYAKRKYDIKEAYNYILDVMKDKDQNIVMGAEYYES